MLIAVTTDWLNFISLVLQNHGVSTLLVLFGCFCIYKVGSWLGKNLTPIFTLLQQMLTNHNIFINNATDCVKSIDDTLKNLISVGDQRYSKHTDTLDDIEEEIKKNNVDLHKKLTEIDTKVTSLHNKAFKVS